MIRPDLPTLEDLVARACAAGAAKLLLLSDQPPTCRVQGQLQPPMEPWPLSFHDTQHYAAQVLDPLAEKALDENGSVELDLDLAGVPCRVVVFYGLGCHNIVLHLPGGAPPQAGE